MAAQYAVSGDENARAEMTELAKKARRDETPSERERRNYAALAETLSEAAVATGMTLDDLLCQTPSRLVGYVYAAAVQAGAKMSKASAAAHADYMATLDAIAKRLRAERDAAKESAGNG